MKLEVSRREFLKDSLTALGFTALPGGFLFAAPEGWKPAKAPNLVFGVLSDTHLRTCGGPGGKPGRNWPDKYFRNALEYFKSRGADAVVHCGDLAHRGQVEEMQYHASAWRKVFGETGGPVKLFVTGNHDTDGAGYGAFVANKYPDPEERAKHVLATDMAANWEKIWGEKYEPVWHKEVKGYHFFGRNQRVGDDELLRLIDETAKSARLDDPLRPFFFMTHSRPQAPLRKRASRGRNAVAFFGHNHWSISNWNMAYLYYGRLPCFECASCEPRGCGGLVGDSYITKIKLQGLDSAQTGRGRHGYLVRMYDDMMVLERHDFTHGEASLGADWVMPFGRGGAHPLSKEELKKQEGVPQFRKGAQLSAAFATVKATAPAPKQEETVQDGQAAETAKAAPAETMDVLRIGIPLADGARSSRAYAYEVAVVDRESGKKLHKAVYAAGINLGIGHEPNGGITTLDIPAGELPRGGALVVAARPLSSLGARGQAISTRIPCVPLSVRRKAAV